MALIVITIRDRENGCEVHLADEPRCTPEQTEFSPAQRMGAVALNAIHAALAAPDMDRPRLLLVDGGGAPLKPADEYQGQKTAIAKLVLAGADELPD